ncbi:MAG: M67 family metallopeptidase [Candidatus Promineofilum sp.]|nr:M67 family metallopeptidase [Promineifilum sp.]MBP9656654.1 M67 family metallopeptidase [Promineifilum sp.]
MRLPSGLIEEILAHAAAHYPEEACGLLGGRDGQATLFIPVENDLHSSVAYKMEPRQHVQAMYALDAAGLEIVAIYHSHPGGPARPSATDVAAAHYPDSAQIIVSLADRMRPKIRAYTIRDEQVKAIELTMTL